MANVSARDKCFQDAVDALNDNLPDDQKIDISHQQPWGKVDGTWRPLGVGERLWNWITNKTIPYRVPDWTVKVNGVPTPGDNKFSGDSFSNRVSPRSGNTQLQDQNEMNQQQHPDNPDYQDLHLNPETCKCDGNPKQQEVVVPAPAFSGAWVPGMNPVNPTVPSFGGAPAPVEGPIIEFPGGLTPVFP